MDEKIAVLRASLFQVKDEGSDYLTRSTRYLKDLFGSYYDNDGFFFHPERHESVQDLWQELPSSFQETSQELRIKIRQVMAEIGAAAQGSPLIDSADKTSLTQCMKRMAAAMRIRKFTSWGVQIHHDDGSYIGADPAGQEETTTTVDVARREFLDSVDTTFEIMQVLSSRQQSATTQTALYPALRTYRPGSAFVMMRISTDIPELQDIRDTVVEVFKSFGITAVRADDLEHSDGVTDRIISELKDSEHLFADLTFERPSVYYEIGYAHALGKAPILFRKKGTYVHFDLAYRNCPEYENLADLRKKLTKRLETTTGKTGPVI